MARYRQRAKCVQELIAQKDPIKPTLPSLEVWEWISSRVNSLWPQWQQARRDLSQAGQLQQLTAKRILVVPGVLLGTDFARRKTIAAGGPLGELLQWADLVAGLHVLGHSVVLEHNTQAANSRLLKAMTHSACDDDYDIIYLDNSALAHLSSSVRTEYRCRFRVLDVYGSQAMYNDPIYKELHNLKSPLTIDMLHLKQYYTFYPMTPDNTFLGFVVTTKSGRTGKENIAILYGKEAHYVKGKEDYIKHITRYLDVHYTTKTNIGIATPGKLVHRGVMSKEEYTSLFDSARVLVGLGHPIEGTGAMECLSRGCVFINPKYSSAEQKIFADGAKPTQRLVTSQIPYLEKYVGRPYVFTVDVNNITDVTTALEEIISMNTSASFIPEEFSMKGYLERISAFVQHQRFCQVPNSTRDIWPPSSNLIVKDARPGISCTDICADKGFICEPEYFPILNNEEQLAGSTGCESVQSEPEIYHPSYTNSSTGRVCVLQEHAQLYSCEGSSPRHYRTCPCRDFRKHQVALPVHDR